MRSLCPLPTPTLTAVERQWAEMPKMHRDGGFRGVGALRRAAGVAAWLWLMVLALNHIYCGYGVLDEVKGPASAAQARALNLLEADARRFVDHGGKDEVENHANQGEDCADIAANSDRNASMGGANTWWC